MDESKVDAVSKLLDDLSDRILEYDNLYPDDPGASQIVKMLAEPVVGLKLALAMYLLS